MAELYPGLPPVDLVVSISPCTLIAANSDHHGWMEEVETPLTTNS